ncbi:MAG TPA: hypothetical protein VNZ22_15755, partial [Bacillota bacterium]|nr:hypothetical protein [Bacillota bacterium]
CFDSQNLYLALSLPVTDTEEAKEWGFSDEAQIGLARRLSESDFGNDFLRLGLNSGTEARNRTPGRKAESAVPGVRVVGRTEGRQRRYEVAIPLRLLLKHSQTVSGSPLIMDLSFPMPDGEPDAQEPAAPGVNTLSYRIRYGSDSLIPVYFVELNLERRR